ncbi:interleukin-6 receptor subunit alpha isoform X3 [Lathamus discolor]|uniref:interleukin-6 receptor subunit alpha isoform X3 n=1 Tax=Lathamus discolor TaxID=678569 RepID=UPI0032B705B9
MSCCPQPLIFLLLAAAAAPRRPCGPLGLSRDTVLGRPGANITLRCWDEAPGNVTVSWRAEERGRSQRLPAGNALPLHRLRHEDAGTYSCFVGSQRLRSLRLLVQEPPETPRVSCYRRSHDHDVLCEWPLWAKPSPGTRAMLWVKQRFTAENATEQRCRFFSKAQKFVCRVKVPRGADDTKPFLVSTCVSNGAGGAAGEDKIITLNGVLRPDPPLNVTVTALEKAPQRLRVNWSYPSSWDHRFYWLRFQVRYRPEPAQTFSEVDQVTTTWLDIHDAWRGLRHVVQVRAQEEFGHGAWSEWSREAVGAPWTGPIMEASARSTASPYPFLVAGGSLLLGIALCIGIVLRYRQLWQMGGWQGAKPEGEGQHVLVPLGPPRPPLSDTPLLSLPRSPAPGGLHVTSLDYFFSGQ